MNINKLGIFFLSTLLFSAPVFAEGKFTAGVGLGSLYGGIGVNVGLQSDTDFKYISGGCVSYSSRYSETCGFGLGYMTTDLFESRSKHHAANFYIGIVGTERTYKKDKGLYGAGLGYSYFFSGIDRSGGNIGFTVLGAELNGDLDLGAMLQLGYQF